MIENRCAPLERSAAPAHTRIDDALARARHAWVDVMVLSPPPPAHDTRRCPWHTYPGTAISPTAIAQIGAVLQAAGYAVDVVDAAGLGASWEAIEWRVWARRPRYLIFPAATPTLTADMRAALIGKAVGSLTLAFGAHVTPLSRETLDAYPALDIVVRGEPELTILDLIQTIDQLGQAGQTGAAPLPTPFPQAAALEARRCFAGVDPELRGQALRAVHGIAFRDERMRVCVTADRAAIDNLDSFPPPLHDELPWHRYEHPLTRTPYACVHTSRGCAAGCRFCLTQVVESAGVRQRSVNHVMGELALLEARGIDVVGEDADLFTVKREFVYDLCSAMIQANMALRWSCHSRPDSVDAAELQVMRQAGCFLIDWTLPGGSGAHATLAASRRAGIKNWGHFLIGLPGTTAASIQATIALSKRLPLDRVRFQVATPYPGTRFYHQAVEHGWLTIERWEDYGAGAVLNYPQLSSRQLDAWVRHAAHAWAWRPCRLLTFLKDRLCGEVGTGAWHSDRAATPIHDRGLAQI